MMTAIKQRIKARVVKTGDRPALWLDEQARPVSLCYAIILRESEEVIFPESLLDDWGYEIKSLHIYEWIRENGYQFPRAEIFGFDAKGNQKQYFLRELDLMARYPCYAFDGSQIPITDGLLIETILLPGRQVSQPERIKPPPEVDWPLRNVLASWWQVPACGLENMDFQASATKPD